MAGYSPRSLGELSTEARGYFAAVDGAVVNVWPNNFTITAKVLALLSREHEDRRAVLYRQIFRASADEAWLERHGYEDGLPREPGLPARGQLRVTAPSGTVIPDGLIFRRSDGALYTSLGAVTATAGGATLPIEADEPGTFANIPAGGTLTLSTDSVAPSSMSRTGTVLAGGLSGGTDEEGIEAYRQRLLAARRKPRSGGNGADYRAWAMSALAPGVVRDVFAERFGADSAIWLQFTVSDQANGVPSPAQVAAVQARIDNPLCKPLAARVSVSAPAPVAVAIDIVGLAPDTPEARAAIATELAAHFADNAEPGRPSGAYRLDRDGLRDAIRRAIGKATFTLAAPVADLSFLAGTMPVLGPITHS